MSLSGRMKIGMLAPPWVAVPPINYGGTELVIDVLCRGLQALGHEVLLFTVGESTCDVPMGSLYEAGDADRMGATVLELRHVAAAYDAFVDCDIVHDHTTAGLFWSQLADSPPIVATHHSPFNSDHADLFSRADVPLIAVSNDHASRAPESVNVSTAIHHGLDTDRYDYDGIGGDYLVALGRMSPDKGVETAIDVAREAGMELRIAAKMREPGERRYFAEVIEPKLGEGVEYLGEVNHPTKISLLAGAAALVNPIRWPEPFGLVMTESLACGTPVIASPFGAATEIIEHGVTGFLSADFEDLVTMAQKASSLDRWTCRESVENYFSMERMAADHEEFYRSVLAQETKR